MPADSRRHAGATASDPPEAAGYERFQPANAVLAAWEPLFFRTSESGLRSLAFRVDENHCNGLQVLHGGVALSLADNAMGLLCASVYGPGHVARTVSLNAQYFDAASLGDWVEIAPSLQRKGRRLMFARCLLTAAGKSLVEVNAVFSVLEVPTVWP